MPKPPTEDETLSQLRNLKLACRSGSSVPPSRQLRWAVYQLVLATAGIDPVTLEGDGVEYTADNVRQRLVVPLAPLWDHLYAEIPGLTTHRSAEQRPGVALGVALRGMFGLRQLHLGANKSRRYAVDTVVLERQRQLLSRMDGTPTIRKLRRANATQD